MLDGSVWMASLAENGCGRSRHRRRRRRPTRSTAAPRSTAGCGPSLLAPDGSLWLTTSNTDGRGDVRDGDDRILRVTLTAAPAGHRSRRRSCPHSAAATPPRRPERLRLRPWPADETPPRALNPSLAQRIWLVRRAAGRVAAAPHPAPGGRRRADGRGRRDRAAARARAGPGHPGAGADPRPADRQQPGSRATTRWFATWRRRTARWPTRRRSLGRSSPAPAGAGR